MVDGYREIFINEVYAFNTPNKAPLIIDCGSNIGLSVFFFKQRFPESKIIAFEADEKIYKILENNIREFDIKNIELHNSAVWIKNGFIDFSIEGGYSGRISKKGDLNISKVPSINLLDLIDSKVDLLKLDIEGAEKEIIKSIESKLCFIDKIFMEYHSHITEPQELNLILEILSRNGFRYYIKESFISANPFLQINVLMGMDLQLNIYAVK